MNLSGTIGRPQAFYARLLLVVLAIIAVLAALLGPALTRGQQRAPTGSSASAIEDIGIAFQMVFAHDHHLSFPD